ncbi:TPA: hypothetical protein ACYE41_004758 [Klebsiella pneumoniae]|uniref:hypothetical protein n=1 Tax=Klebsiella TaxID=570 RepID=UPI002E171100|nr:hypothetical protein [Klebsiella pneumoniae]
MRAVDGTTVPSKIANKLRLKTFSSFDLFRRVFWKTVASDPALSKQFSEADINQVNYPPLKEPGPKLRFWVIRKAIIMRPDYRG